MVYTRSRRLKALAVAAAGLISLSHCTPFSAADSIRTTASASDGARPPLPSNPGFANADRTEPSFFTELDSLDRPFAEDRRHEGVSADDLSRSGIADEQLETFQLEEPDQEPVKPAAKTGPDQADTALLNSTLHVKRTTESKVEEDGARTLSQADIAFLNSTIHVKPTNETEVEEGGGRALSQAEIAFLNSTILVKPTTETGGEENKSIHSRALEITKDEKEVIKQLANSQKESGFWLGLLNGTPYRWELMTVKGDDVGASFSILLPDVLQPGQSVTWEAKMKSDDAQAEVRYNLVGTKEESWLTLNIHRGFPHKVTVKYGGALETVGLADSGKRGSVVDLGVARGAVCATFFLTGAEGRFYANDAPGNWMHTMLDDIGNYTLRDVMLPRSHRAGMYTGHKRYGLGNRINTFTQDFSIYYQLNVAGVRVFDLSPLLDKDGRIWESHGTFRAPKFHGGTGVSHDSLVAQINQFNDDFPGELIILDVRGDGMRSGKDFRPLHGEGVRQVIDSLRRLNHRAVLEPGKDMTRMRIANIIGGGGGNKSAVVIRMPEDRIPGLPPGHGWPGAKYGFVTETELPVVRQWSNKGDENEMLYDQIAALQKHRGSGRGQPLFESDLLLTLKGKALVGRTSVTELNAPAWIMLVDRFWTAFKGAAYPNWVAMDAIRDSSLRGVAMAVNQCFVAKRCGTLGGRVPGGSTTPQKAANGTAPATAANSTSPTTAANN